MTEGRTIWLLGIGLALSFSPGCEQGVVTGTGCELTSDCRSPLVCRLSRCRVECRENRDCGLGQLCLRLEGEVGVCRLEEEEECVTDEDCPAQLSCLNNECAPGCTSHADCGEGAACHNGGCLVTTDGDAGSTDMTEGWVEDGLLLLYDFSEGEGTVVHATRGELSLDLNIENPDAMLWEADRGGLTINPDLTAGPHTTVRSENAARDLTVRLQQGSGFTLEFVLSPSACPVDGCPSQTPAYWGLDADGTNFSLWYGRANENAFYLELMGRNPLFFKPTVGDVGPGRHHLAVTVAAGVTCLYMDARESRCYPNSDSFSGLGTYPLVLGGHPDGTTGLYYSGTYHRVAVYDHPLTYHEIVQNSATAHAQ